MPTAVPITQDSGLPQSIAPHLHPAELGPGQPSRTKQEQGTWLTTRSPVGAPGPQDLPTHSAKPPGLNVRLSALAWSKPSAWSHSIRLGKVLASRRGVNQSTHIGAPPANSRPGLTASPKLTKLTAESGWAGLRGLIVPKDKGDADRPTPGLGQRAGVQDTPLTRAASLAALWRHTLAGLASGRWGQGWGRKPADTSVFRLQKRQRHRPPTPGPCLVSTP